MPPNNLGLSSSDNNAGLNNTNNDSSVPKPDISDNSVNPIDSPSIGNVSPVARVNNTDQLTSLSNGSVTSQSLNSKQPLMLSNSELRARPVANSNFASPPREELLPSMSQGSTTLSSDGTNIQTSNPLIAPTFLNETVVYSTVPRKTKQPLSWKKIILPIVVVIILAVGAVAAYIGYYLPNQPINIAQIAFLNTLTGTNLKSLNFNGSIKAVNSGQSLNLTIAGQISQNGQFNTKILDNTSIANISFTALSPDGKNIYLQLAGLNGISKALSSSGTATSNLKLLSLIKVVNNQWYEVNASVLSGLEKSTNLSPSTTALSQADLNKIIGIYKQNQFLVMDKVYPNQVIAGMNSDHYQVSINKLKLQSFISSLKSVNLKTLGINSTILSSLSNSANNLGNQSYDIWINTSNKLIDQISFYLNNQKQSYNVKLTMSNFNQPVNILAPTNSQSILTLLTAISQDFGGSSSSTGTTSPNSSLLQLLNSSSSLL